jgi:DnaJ domain
MYNTCCKILGVKPGSDINTIKSAYRKAAKELHPDINHFDKASEYFKILQNAYQYLLLHPFQERLSGFNKNGVINTQPIHFNQAFYKTFKPKRRESSTITLREILAGSFIARLVFIFFHLMFLLAGIFLIFNSLYDLFFCSIDPRATESSAYITVVFGFLFGIVITLIFTLSGLNFITRR